MGDFDAAIAIAVALAIEEETDVPKRKRAKWSKEWFLQRSKFGHTKLLRCLHIAPHIYTEPPARCIMGTIHEAILYYTHYVLHWFLR